MKKFSCSLEELCASTIVQAQKFTAPSMCEPCFNPSITDLILNPSLACVRQGVYDSDESDDVEDVVDNWNDDFQTTHADSEFRAQPKPSESEEKGDEVGKPARNDDEERSDKEELKQDPGPKEP